MDKVKQAIRLYKQGVPILQIAKRLGIVRNTVKSYLGRAPQEKRIPPIKYRSKNFYNRDFFSTKLMMISG